MNIDHEALIMQSLHSLLLPSYAQISSISPYSQTPSDNVVGVLHRVFFFAWTASGRQRKSSLKDYQCTVRDSNQKTTGCRYRITAANLCAVYRSSFNRLVRLFRSALSFGFKSEIRMQNTSGVVVREESAGRQEGSACCWRREVALSCCEHGAARPARSIFYLECGVLNLKCTMCACGESTVRNPEP
jgi:hypothetical protein